MASEKPRGGEELKTLASVPMGTHTLNQAELPLLKFMFLLEDIKVRKCEYVLPYPPRNR